MNTQTTQTTSLDTEQVHTRDTALAFQQNPSEKNKQRAFLRYYGDERNDDEVPQRLPFIR